MKPASSLERLLSVLQLFTEDRLEWTPEAMMERLGYARPTLYRYLKTLSEAGLLASHPHAGYTLGPKIVEMDYLLRLSDPLILATHPVLEDLAVTFPGTALLVRWYGDRMLCVDAVNHQPEPLSSYPRGRPMPMGRGAIARAILAFLPKPQALSIIETHLSEWQALGLGDTAETVHGAMRQVRRDGYSMAFGEVTPGVVGTAAPVFDQARSPVGALCLTLRETDTDAAIRARLADRVLDGAADISARLAMRTVSGDAEIAK